MNSFVLVSRSAAERSATFTLLAIDDLGNFGDALAHPAQREAPPGRVGQRSVSGQSGGIGGVTGHTHQSAHAMRAANHTQKDGDPQQDAACATQPAEAASAAFARSCAFFFGADWIGCSFHTGIGARPA